MVVTSAVAIELWEKLLAWERKLKSREGAIVMREDGLVAFECTLGRVRMECDAEHARAEAIRQDYLVRTRAFIASCQRSLNFDQILEECRTLLSI
jgi:hypothetical protein